MHACRIDASCERLSVKQREIIFPIIATTSLSTCADFVIETGITYTLYPTWPPMLVAHQHQVNAIIQIKLLQIAIPPVYLIEHRFQ